MHEYDFKTEHVCDFARCTLTPVHVYLHVMFCVKTQKVKLFTVYIV